MRQRWSLIGVVLLVVALIWWIVQVVLLEPDQRDSASAFGQFLLAAVGLPLSLAGLWKASGVSTAAKSEELADRLASSMREQVERTAVDRRLVQPTPLPLRWRRAAAQVSGPVAAATATHDGQAWLDPLPGLTRITGSRLRSGNRRSLHAIYGGLPSGRLVITGGPGAGKSSAAVLLMLDALRFREQAATVEDRRRIPVPVLFTLNGWDPNTTSVHDWLTSKLTRMPLFRNRNGAHHARELLTTGRLSIFLDGLDEIPESHRTAALAALSGQVTSRLVLLSRSAELADAAQHHGLSGAIVLHIEPLMPKAVAEYLLRPLTEPAPESWKRIAETLTSDPESPVTKALTNPLWVSLVHDIYPPTGMVDELLDSTRFPTAESVTNHLLDHILTAAYTKRPGRASPKYDMATARRTLTYLARRMNADSTRDFLWWQTNTWLPRSGRLLLMTAATLPVYTLSFTATIWPFTGLSFSAALGTLFGLVLSFVIGLYQPNLSAEVSDSYKRNLKIYQFSFGSLFAVVVGYLADPAAGTAFGISTAVFMGLRTTSTGSSEPLILWRRERKYGFVAGTAFSTVFGLWAGFGVGPLFGLAFGLPFLLAISLTVTPNWSAGVMQCYLALRHRTPVRMIRFLEDARSRHLVRTVGPVYQFRHATLQDRLADGSGALPTTAGGGSTTP